MCWLQAAGGDLLCPGSEPGETGRVLLHVGGLWGSRKNGPGAPGEPQALTGVLQSYVPWNSFPLSLELFFFGVVLLLFYCWPFVGNRRNVLYCGDVWTSSVCLHQGKLIITGFYQISIVSLVTIAYLALNFIIIRQLIYQNF